MQVSIVHQNLDPVIYLDAENGITLLFYNPNPGTTLGEMDEYSFDRMSPYYVPASQAQDLRRMLVDLRSPESIINELGLTTRSYAWVESYINPPEPIRARLDSSGRLMGRRPRLVHGGIAGLRTIDGNEW